MLAQLESAFGISIAGDRKVRVGFSLGITLANISLDLDDSRDGT